MIEFELRSKEWREETLRVWEEAKVED